MLQYVLARSAVTPHDVAAEAGGSARTWEELEHRAIRVARALASHGGMKPGDRWAILAGNRIEWPELIVGNVRAGTHYVPLNWHLGESEIRYLLDDSQSRLLVVDPEHEAIGRAAAEGTGVTDVIVIGDEYESWLGAARTDPTPDGPAGSPLLYTGGTTGRSKGVLRSDRGATVGTWANGVAGWGRMVRIPSDGTCLVTTPLYHAFGGGAMSAALALGNRVVITERFGAEEFLHLVEREKVTTAPLVPTQMVRLAKLDPELRARYDLSSLQHVCHTAAPCPAWAKRELIDWWGPVVVEFYGSSEGAGPVVCTSEEWLARPGTIGRPAGGLAVSVVDDHGGDLPPGEIGTLYFKRPDGMPIYHGDPDKTASMQLADGRFTVGDVGWIDDDGYLYLADRRVDLILSGGVNIYPAEIEGTIIGHPGVRDVAVFGIPDPDWGQQVKAAVELEEGSVLDEDELLSWCRRQLATFKCPRSVDFHDVLPRETSGKLKKRLLRDVYWDNVSS